LSWDHLSPVDDRAPVCSQPVSELHRAHPQGGESGDKKG
jgi:hypothetical protein